MSTLDILNIIAKAGASVDDVLAIVSIVGSGLLFLVAFLTADPLHKFGILASGSVFGLLLGALGQFAIAYTDLKVRRIGAFGFTPALVNELLIISFALLVVRWFLVRGRR
jgi:uncharacterized membrane protein YdcZ (DUF606 family)